MKQKVNDLTRGGITSQLLKYALPLIFTSAMQAMYSLVDILIAGRYIGSSGISGINNSAQIVSIVNTIIIGLSMGGNIIISRFFGMKSQKRCDEAADTFLTSFFVLGIITAAVMFAAGGNLLRMMNAPAYDEALQYLRICSVGIFFIFGYNALTAVIRAYGISKAPMYFIMVSTIVNIALDILFMGALGMGAFGAGFATVTAQGISFVLALIFVLKQKFMWKNIAFKIKEFSAILKLGFPCAVQMTVAGISFLVVTYTINKYGVDASAGSGISMKIRDIPFLFISTMSTATSSMIAQNLGAGLYDRAEKIMYTAMKLTLLMSAALIVIVEVFAPVFVGAFIDNPNAVAYGVRNIRIEILGQMFYSVFMIQHSLATGAGHTVFVLCNSFVNCIIFRLTLAVLLDKLWGIDGVFIACAVAPSVSIPIGHWYVKSCRWRGDREKGVLEAV